MVKSHGDGSEGDSERHHARLVNVCRETPCAPSRWSACACLATQKIMKKSLLAQCVMTHILTHIVSTVALRPQHTVAETMTRTQSARATLSLMTTAR